MQLTHVSGRFTKRQFPVVLICYRIINSSNVGSLLRLADAFGLDKLIFIGKETPMGRKVKKASRSTEKYVDYSIVANSLEIIDSYRVRGYKIIALEITNNSIPLNSLQLKNIDKLVLIIGNEVDGIPESILKLSDKVVHIEMHGNNSSMNVSMATAITLYKITKDL